MRIIARDPAGRTYVYSGCWTVDRHDPLARATVDRLELLRTHGKTAFPTVTTWSQALPPRRWFEDNIAAAEALGLRVIAAYPQSPSQEGDY